MKVTLFDYTGACAANPADYAATCLIFTKSTRLDMDDEFLQKVKLMSYNDKLTELKLMSNTNPGSWEFIDLSFLVQGVSRAFTQQLERTRTASYAERTFRIVVIENPEYYTGPSIYGDKARQSLYDLTMKGSAKAYSDLIQLGAKTEDARGVLPLNTLTNICMHIDMRNFINMARKRVSKRVQKEHEDVIGAMIIEIQKVYPWFHLFYKNDQMQAFKDLSNMIADNPKLSQDEKVEIYKKLDLIKGEL